jgi:hypothetical protein
VTIQLLRRRDEPVDVHHPGRETQGRMKPEEGSDNARALERLDRWVESAEAQPELPMGMKGERALLAGIPDRLGKGALRMAEAEARKEAMAIARRVAGDIARSAASKVSRFFAEQGERKALLALSRIPQRTLASLGKALPAKVEAHILEHTRAIVGKPTHSLFEKGTTIGRITALVRDTMRSGARPILSVSENGALAFVFEKEFPNAIGAKGEKALRVVVDLEGRMVTAFPLAAEKKLATAMVRGVTVAASIAPLVFISSLAETEAEVATNDAERRSSKAQESTWYEKVLELVPYGIFESSAIAIEPNFSAIRSRTQSALDEARASLGRELTPSEQEAIRRCLYEVWADAAGQTGAA